MDEPIFRVVKGSPDDAELAALTVVLAGLSHPAEDGPPSRQTSWWTDKQKLLGLRPTPDQNAWRLSLRLPK